MEISGTPWWSMIDFYRIVSSAAFIDGIRNITGMGCRFGSCDGKNWVLALTGRWRAQYSGHPLSAFIRIAGTGELFHNQTCSRSNTEASKLRVWHVQQKKRTGW